MSLDITIEDLVYMVRTYVTRMSRNPIQQSLGSARVDYFRYRQIRRDTSRKNVGISDIFKCVLLQYGF